MSTTALTHNKCTIKLANFIINIFANTKCFKKKKNRYLCHGCTCLRYIWKKDTFQYTLNWEPKRSYNMHQGNCLTSFFSLQAIYPVFFCSPHSNQSLKVIYLFLFAASGKIKRKSSDYNSTCKQLALEKHAQTNISSETFLGEKKNHQETNPNTTIRNISFSSVIVFILYILFFNNNGKHL